jgi:hypothetical protein
MLSMKICDLTLGEGEASKGARGEQLISNQAQEWMGIRSTSKKSWFFK